MGGGDQEGPHASAPVAGSPAARFRPERPRDLQEVKYLNFANEGGT